MPSSITIDFDIERQLRTRIEFHEPIRSTYLSREHIHAYMRITIQGRALPYMGYFGEEDVCFNAWISVLVAMYGAMQPAGDGLYEFDEVEQGQPSYIFRRDGDSVLVSIVESKYSHAPGDSEWQDIPFSLQDLQDTLHQFRDDFLADIKKLAPGVYEKWRAAFKELA